MSRIIKINCAKCNHENTLCDRTNLSQNYQIIMSAVRTLLDAKSSMQVKAICRLIESYEICKSSNTSIKHMAGV